MTGVQTCALPISLIIKEPDITFSKICFISETRNVIPLWADKGASLTGGDLGFYFHETYSDFDLSTIKTFLNEVNSDLESEIPDLSISEIARSMNIAEGPDEFLLPKNVGLLFFGKQPQSVFPSAQIEIITFSDEAGSNYTEKIFTGGLHRQLNSALEYLKDMVVKERVVKYEQRAEADRFLITLMTL